MYNILFYTNNPSISISLTPQKNRNKSKRNYRRCYKKESEKRVKMKWKRKYDVNISKPLFCKINMYQSPFLIIQPFMHLVFFSYFFFFSYHILSYLNYITCIIYVLLPLLLFWVWGKYPTFRWFSFGYLLQGPVYKHSIIGLFTPSVSSHS